MMRAPIAALLSDPPDSKLDMKYGFPLQRIYLLRRRA
jgi:hypothetical protein